MDLDPLGPSLETSEQIGGKKKVKDTFRMSEDEQDMPALGLGGQVGALPGQCSLSVLSIIK